MSEKHPLIIEEECQQHGCAGDIYRAKINRLQAKLEAMEQAVKACAEWFDIEYKSGGVYFTSAPAEQKIKEEIRRLATNAIATARK